MAYTDVDEKNRTRLPVHVAIADIKARNARNQEHFSPEQERMAEKLFADVDAAYFRSRVFRNYRKNFIAIKVECNPYDRFERDVFELNKQCEKDGIEMIRRGSTVIYRIPK